MLHRKNPENPGRLATLAATHGQAAGSAIRETIATHAVAITTALYVLSALVLVLVVVLVTRTPAAS